MKPRSPLGRRPGGCLILLQISALSAGLLCGCSAKDKTANPQGGVGADRNKTATGNGAGDSKTGPRNVASKTAQTGGSATNGAKPTSSRDPVAKGTKTAPRTAKGDVKTAQNTTSPQTNTNPPQTTVKQKAPNSPSAGKRRAALAALKRLGARIEVYADGTVVEVDLKEQKLSDGDLVHLAVLPELERLYLDGTRITDKGLVHIKGLTVLDVLSLSKTGVQGSGLVNLKSMSSLRVLNLSRCAVTDAALAHLKPLTNMETLALERSKIRGPGLADLTGLKRIITLNLDGCVLAGKHLVHLKALQRMKILYLADVKIDKKHKDELEDAISSLAIFD